MLLALAVLLLALAVLLLALAVLLLALAVLLVALPVLLLATALRTAITGAFGGCGAARLACRGLRCGITRVGLGASTLSGRWSCRFGWLLSGADDRDQIGLSHRRNPSDTKVTGHSLEVGQFHAGQIARGNCGCCVTHFVLSCPSGTSRECHGCARSGGDVTGKFLCNRWARRIGATDEKVDKATV